MQSFVSSPWKSGATVASTIAAVVLATCCMLNTPVATVAAVPIVEAEGGVLKLSAERVVIQLLDARTGQPAADPSPVITAAHVDEVRPVASPVGN